MSSHLTGLSQVFGNVSNPQHLFQSPAHADALRLLSGVPEEGRNIRLLTGEPGVGKTMLLLRLLKEFQHSALTAHLFWTQLGRDEFLRYFLHELGVLEPATEIVQGQKQLTSALEREFCQGRKVIVAIDEAQNLEIPALRGLAELLDCDLARSKDMEVVLAGFPQLQSKLASPELEGIRDRISAIVSLSPLTPDETVSYIDRGLEVSGYYGDGPFTSNALAVIATLAEGIPRNINNICCAAFYVAEKRACTVIDSSMVFEAAAIQQGQLITQEAMQPWPALPTEFPAEQVASDQQECASAQEPISTPVLISGITVTESAGDTVANGWVDDQIHAVPDRIRRWFSNQRVAWSGTVGELAAALDEPEPEVVHALRANSDILRDFGIAVTVKERAGRTRSVSLRRLEEQKQTTVEEANPRLKLSEPEVDTHQGLDAKDWPAENLPSHGQPCDRPTENVLIEDAPEAASISPADQARDRTISAVKDRLENTRSLPTPASKTDRTGSAKLRVTGLIAAVLVLIAAIVALQLRSRQTRPSLATEGQQPLQAVAPPSTQSVPGTQTSNGLNAKGAVAKRVLPDVPQRTRMGIQGTVEVRIRVTADSSGNVSNATFDSPGVSRYFANMALQAARGWKFEPAQVDGQAVSSVWTLRFQFRKSGTDVIPVEQSHPATAMTNLLVAPPPPPSPPPAPVHAEKVVSKLVNNQITAPTKIPTEISMVKEEVPPSMAGVASMNGAAGGNAGGVKGNIVGGTGTGPAPVVKAAAPKKIAVSAGVIAGKKIGGVAPRYPFSARALHIQGTVVLQATISKAGTIENLRVLSGPPVLQQAAEEAVRTWRYKPSLLNGEPVEVETQVNVMFTLGG